MTELLPAIDAAPALLLARVLLAAMFLSSATDKLRRDPAEVAMIRRLHLPAPATLEVLTGMFEAACAAALLAGAGARIGAVLLGLFVAFTTLAFVRFWSVPVADRQQVRNVFFGNWAVFGGLTYVAVSGPGAWALAPAW